MSGCDDPGGSHQDPAAALRRQRHLGTVLGEVAQAHHPRVGQGLGRVVIVVLQLKQPSCPLKSMGSTLPCLKRRILGAYYHPQDLWSRLVLFDWLVHLGFDQVSFHTCTYVHFPSFAFFLLVGLVHPWTFCSRSPCAGAGVGAGVGAYGFP